MEVDRVSFYPLLLDILTELSQAHFIAIDLELSGVPSKQVRHEAGKQSLQERYLETKEAAERYQILQIGITCVEQDIENSRYVLKPYNFNLNPIIQERGLEVERIFSFQSGAVEFLLKVGFDLARPFHSGVPYLSRAESREARDKHARRQDKTAMADIQIKPTEVESLAFLDHVRKTVNAWLTSSPEDYVNIAPISAVALGPDDVPEELTRFEKRLVHQIIRAEYPQLATISKRGFVQIVMFSQEREDRILKDRKRELSERVNRQKGFRWIIEAMLGGELGGLDLRECARDPITGEHVFADLDQFRAQFNRAQALLRGNPKMLVGHNCFLDLVYIYRTFVGPLPPTVTEFQQELHALWPMIVDTKYMSTHGCGDISPVSSLEQIASQLIEQKIPKLEVDQDHSKYSLSKVDGETLHEAGYDSFLTAQIAVRLSSKLEKDGTYIDVDGAAHDEMRKTVEEGLAAVQLHTRNPKASKSTPTNDVDEPQSALPEPTQKWIPSTPGFRWKRRGDPSIPTNDQSKDPFTYNPRDLKHRHLDLDAQLTIPNGMPRLGSDFWRVYGNKLRVFGTEEAVCELDPAETPVDSDNGGVTVE